MEIVKTDLYYYQFIEENPEFTGCVIDCIGDKFCYLNGLRHRTDGPAVERANGDKLWYLNGELHRTDGLAVERVNGHKEWYMNGKLHRTDGPAFECANGNKYWYLNGESLTEEEWNYTVRLNKLGEFLNGNS